MIAIELGVHTGKTVSSFFPFFYIEHKQENLPLQVDLSISETAVPSLSLISSFFLFSFSHFPLFILVFKP